MNRLPINLSGRGKAPALASQSDEQALSLDRSSSQHRRSPASGAESKLSSVLADDRRLGGQDGGSWKASNGILGSPYDIGTAPGEALSEYSNYQSSDFNETEDPFSGLDFSTGVDPTAIHDNVAYQSTLTNPQQDLGEQNESDSASNQLTLSTYALSPRHNSIPISPSSTSDKIVEIAAKRKKPTTSDRDRQAMKGELVAPLGKTLTGTRVTRETAHGYFSQPMSRNRANDDEVHSEGQYKHALSHASQPMSRELSRERWGGDDLNAEHQHDNSKIHSLGPRRHNAEPIPIQSSSQTAKDYRGYVYSTAAPESSKEMQMERGYRVPESSTELNTKIPVEEKSSFLETNSRTDFKTANYPSLPDTLSPYDSDQGPLPPSQRPISPSGTGEIVKSRSPRASPGRGVDSADRTKKSADGTRIGSQLIELGDLPDPVDTVLAREGADGATAASKGKKKVVDAPSNDLVQGELSAKNGEALFVTPAGMRPNTCFVGREDELAQMHEMLMDRRRRSQGTSAVLLQCLPGGGKTHLARQYVYSRLDQYPGGIFFIRAKSSAELAAGFWDIARAAKISLDESDAPQRFIKAVRRWFNTRKEWLLVLDGIHFDPDPDLWQFIPDSPNTSLIYTSTERSVAGDHHFMNPQIIKLPLLRAREAQTLLLSELDLKQPTADDRKNSMELVQQMGFLPVVIHTAAQRLKTTDEPLARFAKSYANAPRLRGLGCYLAVVDELTSRGASEALNLMKILSFFSQHVPVEMIFLGISSLDVPVKAFEPATGKSLHNTFKVLKAFALIDRNEPVYDEDEFPRHRLGPHDTIDVIRIHSVVQHFFVDSCRAETQISIWLHRAVALFCQSFSLAQRKINRNPNRSLVEDFRLYEIHGLRLLNHLQRSAKNEVSATAWLSTLQRSLDSIKNEIEQRSVGSSDLLISAPMAFCVSVFDRTSSGSDTGPSTPVGLNLKRLETWGLEFGSKSEAWDIESVDSIEDEIFSTTGSTSTKSSVSSIRYSVIELIVGKFVEDEELSVLYEEARKRLTNERFVRNQRRLLKQFFLDLRPHAKTPIEAQAIRILRERKERISIAEQIWTIINPSSPSRHAQMAALSNQKVDKQGQLDRHLGGGGLTPELRFEGDESDTSSEELEGSDSEEIEFAGDSKYANVDTATEFLLGGSPFKQYKFNLRGFLRLDASPPTKIHDLIVAGEVAAVTKILLVHFDKVAQYEFDWLHELLDIGCNFEEMARLLIDGENASPWKVLGRRIHISSVPSAGFHQKHCVHSGGQKLDTAPRVINNLSGNIDTVPKIDGLGVQEVIGELCGIAGALPFGSDSYECEWGSCVRFDGDGNSVVKICYANGDSPATPSLCDPVLRMLDALRRAYHAIGYLQEIGVCCDVITILRMRQAFDDADREIPRAQVELCKLDFLLVEGLYGSMEGWKTVLDTVRNHQILRVCAALSVEIISTISGEILSNPKNPQENPFVWLHQCALAIQIVSVGILSFAQAHVGKLHPEFLVDSLKELHLLGTCYLPGDGIVVNLVELTCIGDMLREPVLVFRAINNPSPTLKDLDRYDLFASPEDIADTWGPARFIVDTISDLPQNLYAIEIGGGTITRVDSTIQKLHWSAGTTAFASLTFDSRKQILVGGVVINDKCPLNEAECWKHPATNAYLRTLGTHEGGWELREKQVGLQGGQYAVLAFNATYFKHNGVTRKDRQLMLPSNEIDLAFLNSTCGLQISFCTGVARRVALRELLADVMIDFVESKVSKPSHWDELKATHFIVQNFRQGNLEQWFDKLATEHRESAIQIVRSMLEVLKDTGIDKHGEELVVAWVRRESPYSCLRIRCEKTSLWARILADSDDCATFACITPLCLEIKKHKCRGLAVAPWHNVSTLLDTAVCPQLSNRELVSVVHTLAPWKLEHQVSYWIGKSGSNLIAKVWLTNDAEPRLVVRQKVIPEKYRSRLPKAMVERLGRLREQQVSNAVASQVVILAEMPQ